MPFVDKFYLSIQELLFFLAPSGQRTFIMVLRNLPPKTWFLLSRDLGPRYNTQASPSLLTCSCLFSCLIDCISRATAFTDMQLLKLGRFAYRNTFPPNLSNETFQVVDTATPPLALQNQTTPGSPKLEPTPLSICWIIYGIW